MSDKEQNKGKRNIGGVIVGLVFSAIGVAIGVAGFTMASAELEQLDARAPFKVDDVETLKVGSPILLTAKVGKHNALLREKLVLVCSQVKKDKDSSWSSGEVQHPPLIVKKGPVDFELKLKRPCPRGPSRVVPDPQHSDHRWVGLTRGATLTVIGKVESLDPLKVHGEYYYSDSMPAYRSYLSRGRWIALAIAGGFFALGLLVVILNLRRGRS